MTTHKLQKNIPKLEDLENLAQLIKLIHLAIIMDGNRRWALEHGLPKLQGHKKGYDKVKEVADWCVEAGIKVFTVFGFSTENWTRPVDEVSYLMRLLEYAVSKDAKHYIKKGIRVKVIGQRDRLNPRLQDLIEDIERKTRDNDKLLLQIAISYGGRAEIIDAIKGLIKAGVKADQVDEKLVEQHLWTAGVPDPDLILRTSGELRTSGFLTWQGVYSELLFTKVFWPAFSKDDFLNALIEYGTRKRRFGGGSGQEGVK